MAKYVVLWVEDDQVQNVINEVKEWEDLGQTGAKVSAVMELGNLHIAGRVVNPNDGIIYG